MTAFIVLDLLAIFFNALGFFRSVKNREWFWIVVHGSCYVLMSVLLIIVLGGL